MVPFAGTEWRKAVPDHASADKTDKGRKEAELPRKVHRQKYWEGQPP